MAHRIKAIIDVFETQLNTIAGLEVIRNRTLDPSSFPAVSIKMGDEEEIDRTTEEQQFALDVTTEIYVLSNSSSDLDTDLLTQKSAIHQAIKSIRNLNKSYVSGVAITGQREPVFTNVGEKPTGVLVINWRVEYYSPLNNPEE